MVIKLYFEIKMKAVAIIVFHFEFKMCILCGLGIFFFFWNEHFILGGDLYTHTLNVSFRCLRFPFSEGRGWHCSPQHTLLSQLEADWAP